MSAAGTRQNSERGVVETTGDLMMSIGRLSVAMGLFAARQATDLLSAPTRRKLDSSDEEPDGAGRQVTGMVKSAMAVGTSLQRGIVGAALGIAGMGPRGNASTGVSDDLSIPLTTSVSRRIDGVQTVAAGAPRREVPHDEMTRRLAEYSDEALSGGAGLPRRVAGLWKSEGLLTAVGKRMLQENTLRDPVLPKRILPAPHVGFGTGSAFALGFDSSKLAARFNDRCETDYVMFSYEGLGAALRINEDGFFKIFSGSFGLIDFGAETGPSATSFYADYLKQFSPEQRRAMAHGYGRLVAFTHRDIYAAIEEATTLPAEFVEPAVNGVAFAFEMMNNMDVARILRKSAIPFEPAVRAAFQNGLVYGLVFTEWHFPGALARWRPQDSLESELVDLARLESALSMERGYPLAARLADPRC